MIGLIPAAGKAERMGGLPKYLLPVDHPDGYLLNVLCARMQRAGVRIVWIGANGDNEQILDDHAPEGTIVDTVSTLTMSQTVLRAKSWCRSEDVLFGMPDSYWKDEECYPKLIAALNEGADVAAGLFYARPDQHKKLGMCRLADDGKHIIRIVDKPQDPIYSWAWGALAWREKFWDAIQPGDLHVGYALQRAIDLGMDVQYRSMAGNYWDCGTRDEYFSLIRTIY